MRRLKEKQSDYLKLASSPRFSCSRLSSQSSPVTPVPHHDRHVSDGANFMRFGLPSDTIVHVPVGVARLNDKARKDLTRYHYDFESLLHKKQMKLTEMKLEHKEEYLSTIKSVSIPISSFTQVARNRLNFCISPKDLTDSERIRIDIKRRIKSQDHFEPKVILGKDAERSRATFRQSVEAIKGFSRQVMEAAVSQSNYTRFGHPKAQEYFEAVKGGNLNAVEQLLATEKKLLFIKDSIGQTSLHWAAKRNDLGLAKLLKSLGAEINCTDLARRSPLYLASRRDHYDMVMFLLESGASRTIVSLNGTTAGDVAKEGSMVWSVLNRRGLNTSAMAMLLDPRQRKSLMEVKKEPQESL